MTAVGTTVELSNANTPQAELRVARIQTKAGSAYTYTPTNSTGKTIRVLSCYEAAAGAVIATVSSGVITIDAAGTGSTGRDFRLLYWLQV